MPDLPRTEQEDLLEGLFEELRSGFRELEAGGAADRQRCLMQELTNKMRDAKVTIKEFEREARTDGMPAKELTRRKAVLVDELNTFIALKKAQASLSQGKQEPPESTPLASTPGEPKRVQDMKTEEVIAEGRKAMRDVDVRLARAERVVEDTVQIGVQTAATLHEQSKQMDKIVDDLDEIEFTMKAAGRVVRDITRGIMTDRCIRCLLFLILVAIIVVVVLKVTDDDDDSFPKPKVFGEGLAIGADMEDVDETKI